MESEKSATAENEAPSTEQDVKATHQEQQGAEDGNANDHNNNDDANEPSASEPNLEQQESLDAGKNEPTAKEDEDNDEKEKKDGDGNEEKNSKDDVVKEDVNKETPKEEEPTKKTSEDIKHEPTANATDEETPTAMNDTADAVARDDMPEEKAAADAATTEAPTDPKPSQKETTTATSTTDATTTTEATKQALAATLEEDNHNFEGFKSFPEKLMSLLDSEELKDHIWWLPDGDSFAFIPEGFADAVLNVHFQGTRLESFTRKLNRWGFRRVAGSKVPKNTLAFYHHDFSKGKPEGLKMMTGSNKRAQIMKQKTAEKKSKLDHSQPKADVNAALGYMVPPSATSYLVPQVLGHNIAQGSAFTPAAFTDPSLAGHPYDPHSIMTMQYYQSQHRRAAAEMALAQEREALLEAELQRMRALRQVGFGAMPPFAANPQQHPLAGTMPGTQNDESYNVSQQPEDNPNVRPV